MLETPLEMVLAMLRGVGAPLDPLTIEGLEANIRDDDIRCVGHQFMLRCSSYAIAIGPQVW